MLTPFKNKKTECEFLGKGYVLLPLLNDLQLTKLREVFSSFHKEVSIRTHNFNVLNDNAVASDAFRPINLENETIEIIRAALELHFEKFEIIDSAHLIHQADTLEEYAYRQEWSYTNEKEHAFITCFIPLNDTCKGNGCMALLEGTHQGIESIRSSNSETIRIPFEQIPKEMRTDLPMEAGQCLAYHQAIFHCLKLNQANVDFTALRLILKHQKSPIYHYIRFDNEIRAYQLTPAAFRDMLSRTYHTHLPQESKLVETFAHEEMSPEVSEVKAAWRSNRFTHRLLCSDEPHRTFQLEGYVHIRGALDTSIIEQLKENYHRHFTTGPGMFVTHHYERNVQTNKRHSEMIFSCIKPLLQNYFVNIRPLIGHYAAKTPGADGLFNLHQDWSIVPEELYGVIHCWIPLQAVSPHNGTLAVIPRSHLVFHNYRSGTCPIRFVPFEPLRDRVIEITAEPGDVVLYHPALFHGSGVNHSHQERVAVVAAICHKEAPTVYYHHENSHIYEYVLTEDDLFGRLDDLAAGSKPLGNVIRKVPKRVLDITDEEIIRHLNSNIPTFVSHVAF
ncbi:MAG: phytanoyl-CoA dioxygenase family protein [Chitinophagales bacterium]|nr:phytanoyl-CoA dioxygenase family protein [Chitinophagales bacterium]MDW8417810.1 phytanoyl-CoA dioxygenase family protein [Chitinophagales bacterium]